MIYCDFGGAKYPYVQAQARTGHFRNVIQFNAYIFVKRVITSYFIHCLRINVIQ